ncbi:flagellar FlbD family protein [Isoptericola sp. NPDC057391]|uniref:flagellar FlbD family protein n=1 Tax=Isoptericola sp. NPDC057391 TaxID=3346117 RepID=UPI00362D5B1C
MIVLTRYSAERIALNADLVTRVENGPDTRVTLIDGSRYIVSEPMDVVIRLIEEYKARVLALARTLPDEPARAPLELVRPAAPTHDDQPVVTPRSHPRRK